MARTQIVGLGGLLLVSMACGAVEKLVTESPDKKALKRLEFVFETIRAHGNSTSVEFQTAACRFFKDKVMVTDSVEFEMAYDALAAFMREGGLAKGLVYSIDEYEEGEGGFIFYGTANGNKFELVVPEARAFRWRVAPSSGF